jgi:hypothetical protein
VRRLKKPYHALVVKFRCKCYWSPHDDRSSFVLPPLACWVSQSLSDVGVVEAEEYD